MEECEMLAHGAVAQAYYDDYYYGGIANFESYFTLLKCHVQFRVTGRMSAFPNHQHKELTVLANRQIKYP